MKRWEMLIEILGCGKFSSRNICELWSQDPDDEMDYEEIRRPSTRDQAPARDLGRDIAAAQIVVAAKGDDEWCATLLQQWERLTGRAKDCCEQPSDSSCECEICVPYWSRMEAEGLWDRQAHRWTEKGMREATK